MILITRIFFLLFHSELVTRKFYFYLLFRVCNSEILLFLFFRVTRKFYLIYYSELVTLKF